MISSYVKIALRTLRKYKGYSTLNIVGLAVGLACCLIIFLFVRHELSYDRFHENASRIYRLTLEVTRESGTVHMATTSPPMGPALVREYPEIGQAVRFRDPNANHMVSHGEKRFYERELMYADPTFFEVFSFPLLHGDVQTALKRPNAILLSAQTAFKYFGEENPIGKTLLLDDSLECLVTGVFQPIPKNSHIQFDLLLPFAAFKVPFGYPVTLDDWGWTSFYTYVQLRPGTDVGSLEGKLQEFMKSRMPPRGASNYSLHLQPLTDVYFSEPLRNHASFAPSGDRRIVLGLSLVAILTLAIAWFNFMNLAVANATKRGKEVGVRRVLGGSQSSIAGQFLMESLILAVLASLVALFMTELAAGLFSRFIGWSIPLSASDYLLILPLSVVLTLIIGVGAGIYPALALSRVHPLHVLKRKFTTVLTGTALRKGLVGFQFVASITLLIGAIGISEQLRLLRTKDLGFDKEQVVVLHLGGAELQRVYPRLKSVLLETPQVASVSMGGGMFDGSHGSVPFVPEGGAESQPFSAGLYGVYPDFCRTMGIQVVEGREFSEDIATDSVQAMMINRAAAAMFGWDQPVGKTLRWVLSRGGVVSVVREGTIIGLTEDFHVASLREQVAPLVMMVPSALPENVYVRIGGGDPSALLTSLGHTWETVVPHFPFQFTFLDQRLDQLYKSDQQFGVLMNIFTGLAILISLVGLYGLVAVVVESRTKEVGIRKVLGSSVVGIISLLSKDFLNVVLAANIVAWPLAYLFLARWLQGFAYQIEMSIHWFALSGMIVLGVAFITICLKSLKTARTNPVEALRYE
jgi:putative ABC transport system permease protein